MKKLDTAIKVVHHTDDSLIKSKYSNVFFRNQRARYWAENTRDSAGVSCTEHVSKLANTSNYLIIHPNEDANDIPKEYKGHVIRYIDKSAEQPNFSN